MNTNHAKTAYNMWNGGASNPRALARALTAAIDDGHEDAASVLCDHLAFVLGLPQPSAYATATWWEAIFERVRKEAQS